MVSWPSSAAKGAFGSPRSAHLNGTAKPPAASEASGTKDGAAQRVEAAPLSLHAMPASEPAAIGQLDTANNSFASGGRPSFASGEE
jgi:hypothetical protein